MMEKPDDLFPDTVPDQRIVDGLAELRRELRIREGCYPRWVQGGKLTQDASDRQIGALKGVIELLEGMLPAPTGGKEDDVE